MGVSTLAFICHCEPSGLAFGKPKDELREAIPTLRNEIASACFARLAMTLQSSRDQQLHDLIRPCIDAHYAGVAEEARDRIFVHEAIAAEQLQAAVHDGAEQVGEPVFRHRGG